jgi:enolase
VNIRSIEAWEALDSRGNPTVAAEVTLAEGTSGAAKAPSGASTGRHEALELRDGDAARYGGKGVLRAVENVNRIIGPAVAGMDSADQAALDRRMIELDGTPDKSRLGANAILAVSCAVARAEAAARRVPLWDYLRGSRTAVLPLPMINIISGGLHAGRNFDFQDFLIVPHGFSGYASALEAAVSVHRETREVLSERGYVLTGVADEGGWGPRLERDEIALDVLMDAIARAGYRPGEQISIAIDVAASHFSRPDYGVDFLVGLVDRYPVVSIEDGLPEDDWDGWRSLTETLGRRVQLIGDDLFATNPARLEEGIRRGTANAVLVKMNQIGTLTETFAVIDRAREAGYRAVISARSGETEDDFLADLAVASGAGQIKIGSVRCSERLAKYNRLLRIEQTAGPRPSWSRELVVSARRNSGELAR